MTALELKFDFVTDKDEDKALCATWDWGTDVFVFSGDIRPGCDKTFNNLVEEKRKGKKVLLYLSTYGGDADSAYRMARCLQRNYEEFRVCVLSDCKSAGTLLVLGAKEIVMGAKGELGPLDVQMFQPDEFVRRSSGLTLAQAIDFIQQKAFSTWEHIFLSVRRKSDAVITTKTAADIATSITTGLFAPVCEKLDPALIGEMKRSVEIALDYGTRLGARPEVVQHLTHDYPSHSFVIDFEEASELLGNVRKPTPFEQIIAAQIMSSFKKEFRRNFLSSPCADGLIATVNICLNESTPKKEDNEDQRNHNQKAARAGAADESGTPTTPERTERKKSSPKG